MARDTAQTLPVTTREKYFNVLRSSLEEPDFYRRLAVLVQQDRYFVPAYIEHIWHAIANHNVPVRTTLLQYAKGVLQEVVTRPAVQKQINDSWSAYEMNCLVDLLIEMKRYATPLERYQIRLLEFALRSVLKPKVTLSPTGSEHLRCVETIDHVPLLAELNTLNPLWWNVDVSRSSIKFHQHTSSILLRSISTRVEYEPVDGPHESVPVPAAVAMLPKLHNTLLSLAERLEIGLARVAIVKMSPWHQSYRHYDGERFLQGRNRYHLVLQAGKDNILSSGPETVIAKPGEVWFFDNKAMHRAENRSSKHRIHVIFDGYPLANVPSKK